MVYKGIRFGNVIVGDGTVVPHGVVLVNDDRIAGVFNDEHQLPPNTELLDLSEYTGIPGLIDVHTHMTYYWDQTPGTNPWLQAEQMSAPVTVFLAQENARKTLETGVTTVRDMGAYQYTDLAMRELIDRGAMLGPRMFVSGYGLHVTYEPASPFPRYPTGGKADGAAEVMRVVREQIAAGVDVIKMFASTGTGNDVRGLQTYTYEEMRAAVEVAHNYGKKIAVHTYGASGAWDAVRAGADSIEHPVDMDDRTLEEMVKRGTVYVPTIDHNRYYAAYAHQYGYGAESISRLLAFIERNVATTRQAIEAGVKIAMGSDAVFTMFGENTWELKWFIEAGMTPEQALATATIAAAELLGKSDSLGVIKAGAYADLVAIDGDPLRDLQTVIDGVKLVFKSDKIVVDNRNLYR